MAVTLWAGVFSNSHLPAVVTLSAEYEDSYLALVALSRQFALGKHIRLEVEGQIGKHIGAQKQWELNALVIARWVTFPWNAYLSTTFAFGEGISYATELPKLEEHEEGASQWLNYLLFELIFALPKHPEWALVARLHHRSGFWGTLAPNGSNVVGVGLSIASEALKNRALSRDQTEDKSSPSSAGLVSDAITRGQRAVLIPRRAGPGANEEAVECCTARRT